MIAVRQIFGVWGDLGTFTRGMIGVSFAEEAAPSGASLKQHSVTCWVGRSIRHAMLDDMDVDAGSIYLPDPFPYNPFNDFLHSEVRLFGPLFMKEKNC